MGAVSLGVAVFVFLVSAGKLVEALYAVRKVPALPAQDATTKPPRLPRLSVVIPALDEEEGLEDTLRCVLAQDYPDLEVVLVDDRSTDGTGETMDRAAAGRGNVSVIHVSDLPEGWLGKNHAIYVGAHHATGEWLLFTDADVRPRPGAYRRAVSYAEADGLDHLALAPALDLSGYWLRGVVAFFYTAFLVYRGYYRANVPSSGTGVGIGAFNLIRRRAYEEIGTYAALALRPDDDISLGGRVKRLGLRQRWLTAPALLSVGWYASLKALIRGLEKNAFAALDYSIPKATGYLLGMVLVTVWPFAAVFVSEGFTSSLYLGAAAAQLVTHAVANRFLGWRLVSLVPAYPVCALILCYILLRSTALALARGGIRWRGTFYPLSLLRRGKARSLHRRDPGVSGRGPGGRSPRA